MSEPTPHLIGLPLHCRAFVSQLFIPFITLHLGMGVEGMPEEGDQEKGAETILASLSSGAFTSKVFKLAKRLWI